MQVQYSAFSYAPRFGQPLYLVGQQSLDGKGEFMRKEERKKAKESEKNGPMQILYY